MKNPALLLIDIQKGFEDIEYWGGNRNNPQAEANCKRMLLLFRNKRLPVYHVRHSSQNRESRLHKTNPGFEFKDEVKPITNELIITKQVNSAFIGTNLLDLLRSANIKTLIIAGLTTDHCVSTTVRMSANYGFKTIVISDATATFDKFGIEGEYYDAEIIHKTALASLKDEFAEVLTTHNLIQILSLR